MALIHEQLEAAEFALPPKELLEFAVQSVAANQLYLQEHVPEVFDGDMVIFAAARDGNKDDDPNCKVGGLTLPATLRRTWSTAHIMRC